MVVVQVEELLGVQAEDPSEGAQVTPGVEVAAAGLEVVDLDALEDVRPDPGALAEHVDAQPGTVACGCDEGTDECVLDRPWRRELVDPGDEDGVLVGALGGQRR